MTEQTTQLGLLNPSFAADPFDKGLLENFSCLVFFCSFSQLAEKVTILFRAVWENLIVCQSWVDLQQLDLEL